MVIDTSRVFDHAEVAMPLRDEQRDMLQANAARDRAEHLLRELRRLAAETEHQDRPDLSDEEREFGRLAMKKAIEAAERMVGSLNQAMDLAQDAVDAGGWDALDEQRRDGGVDDDATPPPRSGDDPT